MDEFSWFVGLYEGEGCFGSRRNKKVHKNATYYNSGIYITIKMTDEDTIARCAKFLGVKYKETKSKHKQLYLVRKMGGKTGQVRDLIEKMIPHLSQRRQEQIRGHIQRAEDWGDTKLQHDN